MAELSPKQIKSVRNNLIQQRSKILKTQKAEVGKINNPNNILDGGDFICHKESDAVTLSIFHNNKVKLENISAAFKKIDTGNYGVCQGCQCTISEGRLEAVPHAILCIKCQSAKE